MLIESIFFATLACSLGGIVLILLKKMPVLNSLSANGSSGIREHRVVIGIEQKVKKVIAFFENQIWLHKILSRIKVIVLRIETKIDNSLHRIRKKSRQK